MNHAIKELETIETRYANILADKHWATDGSESHKESRNKMEQDLHEIRQALDVLKSKEGP